MAITLGKNAEITFGASSVGKLLSLSISYSDSMVDVTTFDSSAREYEALALPDWTISGEALFDSADTGQDALRTVLQTPAALTTVVYPEGQGAGKIQYTGSVFIESCDVASADLEGAVRVTFSGKADGGMTEGTDT